MKIDFSPFEGVRRTFENPPVGRDAEKSVADGVSAKNADAADLSEEKAGVPNASAEKAADAGNFVRNAELSAESRIKDLAEALAPALNIKPDALTAAVESLFAYRYPVTKETVEGLLVYMGKPFNLSPEGAALLVTNGLNATNAIAAGTYVAFADVATAGAVTADTAETYTAAANAATATTATADAVETYAAAVNAEGGGASLISRVVSGQYGVFDELSKILTGFLHNPDESASDLSHALASANAVFEIIAGSKGLTSLFEAQDASVSGQFLSFLVRGGGSPENAQPQSAVYENAAHANTESSDAIFDALLRLSRAAAVDGGANGSAENDPLNESRMSIMEIAKNDSALQLFFERNGTLGVDELLARIFAASAGGVRTDVAATTASALVESFAAGSFGADAWTRVGNGADLRLPPSVVFGDPGTAADIIKGQFEKAVIYLHLLRASLRSSSAPPALKAALERQIASVEDGVRIINDLNERHHYVQIPLSLYGSESDMELFVMKRGGGRKRINPEDATLFISLNTVNLGRVDALIKTGAYKSVSLSFRLDGDDALDLMKAARPFLHTALAKKGYRLSGAEYRVSGERITAANAVRRANDVFAYEGGGVDIRI